MTDKEVDSMIPGLPSNRVQKAESWSQNSGKKRKETLEKRKK